MSHSAAAFAESWAQLLAESSIRWGVVLALLWLWFLVRPPRAAAVRYLLLCMAVGVGAVLPLVPRWGPGLIAGSDSVAVHQRSSPDEAATAAAPAAMSVATAGPDLRQSGSGIPHSVAPAPAPLAPVMHPPGPQRTPAWSVNWRAILAIVWLAGLSVCLTRLAIAWRLIARARREVAPVEGPAAGQCDELRAELRVRRRPVVARHPDVNSPLLIGGRRPVVLVPAGWEALSASARRDCLAHELSHLARGDDWVRLLLEGLRSVFFFHPLVHWLIARSRKEQEVLSDECVVRAGADPERYARTLGEFARRAASRKPFGSCWAAPVLPFISRSTAVVRIRKLLDEPPPEPMTRLKRARGAAAVTLAAAFALVIGSTRLTAVEPAAESPDLRKPAETRSSHDPRQRRSGPEAEPKSVETPAEKDLRLATARAVLFLREAQKADGSFEGPDRWRIGTTSLCTFALLRSGIGANDPDVRNALAWLAAAEPPTMVYEISLQTLAFCAADPKQYGKPIQRNVDALITAQIRAGGARGGWSYGVGRSGLLDLGGDRSNSEFALWALDEAVRAGAKVDPAVWRLAYEYWNKGQNADGGWGYTGTSRNTSPSTGSMTTSGIASIQILAKRLAEADKRFVPEEGPTARAWDWMAQNFDIERNPASSNWLFYYLMTLRRAADLSDRRDVGRHDWYREGKEFLLRSQNPRTGRWDGIGSIENAGIIATPMALLFLNPPPNSPARQ